tara:strand:+ start:651 stop:1214 length:564 start_codon:yes stop_codon:yes gene_type:complete
MRSSRRKLNNSRSEGVNFDKKFDQIFEAGRQIADGFSGARPGTRKRSSFRDFSRRNVRNVGNWVTDKMDSFFEDDYEEWTNDDFDVVDNETKTFGGSIDNEEDFSSQPKRPLESISLRLKDNIVDQQKRLAPLKENSNQEWEEDSFFQTNKWKRPSQKKDDSSLNQKSDHKRISTSRNFPRSRRSRL